MKNLELNHQNITLPDYYPEVLIVVEQLCTGTILLRASSLFETPIRFSVLNILVPHCMENPVEIKKWKKMESHCKDESTILCGVH